MYSVSDETRKPIFEGVQGENEAREIQFDISSWIEELGEGVCTATAKRPTDTIPYPVTVTRSGNVVTWKPNSTDTSIEGIGAFQLAFSINNVVAKTRIWNTKIAPSLVGAGDPPDPYDDWIQDLRDIAAETLTYSQNAANSADDAKAEKLESEAWAKGTKNGTPVPSTADQYQNNAKYFAEESYKNAEAWAVGQRGGVDVPSTDPTYHNNAKYWAEQSLANQYGAFIVKSASGSIASFADGADDVPMKSVKVAIVPKQAGSGDPSPSNVRPITGTSTANVFVTGKNMVFGHMDYAMATESGGYSISNIAGETLLAYLKEGETYRISGVQRNRGIVAYYDHMPAVGDVSNVYLELGGSVTTFVAPRTGIHAIYVYNAVTDTSTAQVELGATATAYEPYNGHTTPVPLGQTVYGGEVDVVSGEMKITHAYKTFGQLSWYLQSGDNTGNLFYAPILDAVDLNSIGHTGWCDKYACYVKGEEPGWWYRNMGDLKFIYSVSGISNQKRIYVRDNSYTDASSFASANANTQLVYELATPATVQLTPTQVATLLGTNNVWADCGDIAVEYRADPTLAYNELANVIVSLGGNI